MRLLLSLSILGVAGCTAAKVTPKIEAFGKATATQAKLSREYLSKKRIEKATTLRRRTAMAMREGFYHVAGCGPVEVDNVSLDADVTTLRYAARCPMVPVKFTDDDELVPLDPTDYSGFSDTEALTLLQAARADDDALRNGARIADGLETYAKALHEIAVAEDHQALVENFKTAADAIEASAKAAAKSQDEPVDTGVFAVAGTVSALTAKYLAQTLEIARYQAIATLVRGADPMVQDGARSVALAVDRFERGESDALYLTLQKEAGALEAAYADGEQTDAVLAKIETVEKTRLALEKADEERMALKILHIAQTHSAVHHALREGANTDDILAAQETIVELVDETDALVKAIEDAKGGQT